MSQIVQIDQQENSVLGNTNLTQIAVKNKPKQDSGVFNWFFTYNNYDLKEIEILEQFFINKNLEVKHSNTDPVDYVFNLGAINNTAMSPAVSLTDCLTILTGVTDGTRIGQKIRTKKAVLKFIVSAGFGMLVPCYVQVFIGVLKADPGTLPTAGALAGIFQDGQGTAAADGSLSSLLRSVNKDRFTVSHYLKFKLGLASTTVLNNNDFPLVVMKSIKLNKLYGDVKYSIDNSAADPNKNLFMWCTYTNITGSTGSTTISQVPNLNWYVDYEYSDA